MGKLDDDIDDIDIDDFDDIGDGIDPDERVPSSGIISKRDFEELGKGIASRVKDKAYDDLVPSNFKRSAETADEIYSELKDTVSEGIKGITSEFGGLLKEFSKVTPGFISKPLDYIAEKLGYMEESDQRRLTEEEQRHSTITSRLDQIFSSQQSVNNAISAKTSGDISALNGAIGGLVNFHYTIAKEYYKTSLELQYKSYYVQYDILATQRTFFKSFNEQLIAISKNTSLPDYLKYAPEEYVGDLIKRNALNNMFSSLSNKDSYISRVKSGLKKYFTGKIQDTRDNLNMVREHISMATGLGSDMGMSKLDMLKTLLIPNAANAIGDKLYSLIPEKIKTKIKESKFMKKADVIGTSFVNSPSATINILLEKLRSSKWVPEFLREEMDEFSSIFYDNSYDSTLEKRDLNKLSELTAGAAFDNKVYRSITEVIPEYLAFILKETRISANVALSNFAKEHDLSSAAQGQLRDAFGGEKLKYDFIEDRLSTEEDIRLGVLRRIKKETEKDDPYNKARDLYYEIYKSVPDENDPKFKSLKVFLEKAQEKKVNISSIKDVFSEEKRKAVFEGMRTEKQNLLTIELNKLKKKYEDLSDGDKVRVTQLAKEILVSNDMVKFKDAINGIAKLVGLGEEHFNDLHAIAIYKALVRYRLSNKKPITISDFINKPTELFKELSIEAKEKDSLLSKLKEFTEALNKSPYRYIDLKEDKDMLLFISIINMIINRAETINRDNVKKIVSAYRGTEIVETKYDEKTDTVSISKNFVLGDFKIQRRERNTFEPIFSGIVKGREDMLPAGLSDAVKEEKAPVIDSGESLLTDEEFNNLDVIVLAVDKDRGDFGASFESTLSSLTGAAEEIEKGVSIENIARTSINVLKYTKNIIVTAKEKIDISPEISFKNKETKEKISKALDTISQSIDEAISYIEKNKNKPEMLLEKLKNLYSKYYSDTSDVMMIVKKFIDNPPPIFK